MRFAVLCADIRKQFHYIDLRKAKQVFYGYISQVTLATWMELLADVTESFNSSALSVQDCMREGDPFGAVLSRIAAGDVITDEEMEQAAKFVMFELNMLFASKPAQ